MNISLAEKIYSDIKNNEPENLTYGDLSEHLPNDEKIKSIISKNCHDISEEEIKRLFQEFFGLGPIEAYLLDSNVSEIIVTSPEDIWIEQHGLLKKSNDRFLNTATYNASLKKISELSEAHTTYERPTANGEFQGHRVHYVNKFLTKDHDQICIRKHPKNSWTLQKLVCTGWASFQQIHELKQIISNKENFIVVGPTGSGKTSVLNACLCELLANERVVLIEDCSELIKPNTISTKLITRSDAFNLNQEITQNQLVKEALRMRPDRIVMGEVRGGEAKDLLMALATGHSGSMGSLHSTNAKQALIRLEMLIQMGAPDWNIKAIRNLIFISLQKIVVVGRKQNGDRFLDGIYRLSSIEDHGILIEKTI